MPSPHRCRALLIGGLALLAAALIAIADAKTATYNARFPGASGRASRADLERVLSTKSTPFLAQASLQKLHANCTTCADKSTCCDGEQCCSGGSFCCSLNAECCGDVCCDGFSQSCCPDNKNGGICCERESTACCLAEPTAGLPSRCCPRWFVCCAAGKYGCCDPGSGLAMEVVEERERQEVAAKHVNIKHKIQHGKEHGLSKDLQAPGHSAFALMIVPTWEGSNPMFGFEFDLTGSKKLQSPAVTGFTNWGEMTRKFAFDRSSQTFYLPQANFTGPGKDEVRKISLYSLNPKTGVASRVEVTGGPVGLVTGFAFDHKTGTVVMATRAYSASGSAVGYKFWKVAPSTGVASLISISQYSSGSDNYAGWFKELGYINNALFVYRLGYLYVTEENGSGMAFVDLSKSTTTPVWVTIPAPAGYGFMSTITLSNLSGTEFVGLAAASGVLSQDLALFRWKADPSMKEAKPVLVAALGNANDTPYFGPLGFSISADMSTFSALVVHDSFDSDYDLWAMSTVDLASGSAVTSPLDPWMMADTDSISGFGLV